MAPTHPQTRKNVDILCTRMICWSFLGLTHFSTAFHQRNSPSHSSTIWSHPLFCGVFQLKLITRIFNRSPDESLIIYSAAVESASYCIEYSKVHIESIYPSLAGSVITSGRIRSLHLKLRVVITLYVLSFSPTACRCCNLFVAHPSMVSQHNRDDVWILLSTSLQWKVLSWGVTPCITLIESRGVV